VASEAPLIELRAVTRAFPIGDGAVRALDHVDLAIQRGEFVAIMGASGSGKSTLLNILGCLDRPTSGTYRLEGTEVGTLSEDALAAVRQQRIGFIFQFFHLIPRLTATRNVELPMIFAGVPAAERQARAHVALAGVGLEHRAAHRPDQLSGGERQRVAIARAIVMRPSVLLADEPTGNLDSASGAGIVQLLETMNAGGLTVVLVTHDPEVGRHAQRILEMRDGRLTGGKDGAGGTGADGGGAGGGGADGGSTDGGGAA
jgi:putative ABC transport system ATP-binding protein